MNYLADVWIDITGKRDSGHEGTYARLVPWFKGDFEEASVALDGDLWFGPTLKTCVCCK